MITLKKGEIGPFVQLVKLALKRAGYETDLGISFGDGLEETVKQFQAENGIASDGIVGSETWERLKPYILGYRTVYAADGDTLQSISETNNADYNAVKTANPKLGENLKKGDRVIVPFKFSVVPTDIKYTGELVSYITEGLAARYPFLETGSFGKSVMGKELYYIKIGTGETEVFYNAEHHANEWITTPVLLKFTEEYADAYSNSESLGEIAARELYESKTLYVAAAVNPDGMDIVNGGMPVGEFYNNVLAISKNYPNIPFPDGWKANVAGTDLNLNYPANWNKARENKYALGFISPAPRDFVGTEPLSAPESLAVYNFTVSHNFKLTLSYHTQGKTIYWKYLEYLPPNSYTIGVSLSEASGYTLELTPPAAAYAGYKDWFIQAYNRPGYTIEAGLGTNPLPLEQFDEIYRDNLGLLVTALEMA